MKNYKPKINYNDTFVTTHSRDYYRGSSFHYSGKWIIGAHYVSDDYNVDFVVHDQVLLACAKSHLSSRENEPINYIYDDRGGIIGVISKYWDFIMSGINGKSPGIKIIDKYWYTCDDTSVPVEEQVWVNTGYKATLEYSDLTPEEIAELQQPGIDAATEVINRKIQYNTTAYWSEHGDFIPDAGAIIIYSDYEKKRIGDVEINIPGIKIGSGNGYLSDLAFVGEQEKEALLQHIANTDIHITSNERTFWNSKLNVSDSEEVLNETLILTRN